MLKTKVKIKWLIWSIEHDQWWRPDWKGYTEHIHEAGRYSYHEAREICAKANFYGQFDRPHESMVQDYIGEKLLDLTKDLKYEKEIT